MAKSKNFKQLRASLIADLEARGLNTVYYIDKVDEYMDFWERRQMLRRDIKKRGVSFLDEKGKCQENRSVSLEIQTSRQMLAIFQSLGFKDATCNAKAPSGEDDDDDL